MRPSGQIAIGLAAGAVAVGALWFSIGEQETDHPASPSERAATTPQDVTPSSSVEQPRARNAAPGMAFPGVADGPLERIAPVAPEPAEPEKNSTAAPSAAKAERRYRTPLHRVVAMAAGEIRAGAYLIRLDGLQVTSPDETCVNASGASWPCGAAARTAFRGYLRTRSINCAVPRPAPPEPVVTDCTLSGDDVALWLARNGWARAEAGSAYVEAAQQAAQQRRGLSSDGR